MGVDRDAENQTGVAACRCPKIINLGSAKTDLFYERKKYGFKKR